MSDIGKPIKRHEVLPLHNPPQETPGERRREPLPATKPAVPSKEPTEV